MMLPSTQGSGNDQSPYMKINKLLDCNATFISCLGHYVWVVSVGLMQQLNVDAGLRQHVYLGGPVENLR